MSGAVLWATGFTVLGYVAGANWREIERWTTWIAAAVVVLLALAGALRWRRLERPA